MVLYGYNIQVFTLPFLTHHSPSLQSDYLNNYSQNTIERLQYWWTAMKDTTNYGYIFPRQLIYFVGPHIFIPRLSGFFFLPGYGFASSLGSG